MRKWRWCIPAGILALVLIVAATLNFGVKAQNKENSVIPDNVYFNDILVSGLTKEEAIREVEEYVEQLAKKIITLSVGEDTSQVTAEDLGLYWTNQEIAAEAVKLGKAGNLIARYKAMKDLEKNAKVYTIGISVDIDKITAVVEAVAEELNQEAVDGKLEREEGQFIITPGIKGLGVKVEESAALIEAYFTPDWDKQDATFELVTEEIIPKGTQEELSMVKDILGSFYTYYNPEVKGRSKNVETGAGKIDGIVLYPGEELSTTGVCGPYTEENGYDWAGAYENGQSVQSMGGGICQVATTLYNALIRAELEITERFPHSMTVVYSEVSSDAAIAGTYKDLKFMNNTEYPIYLEGYAKDGFLQFTVYGYETRDDNREVIFESEILSEEEIVKQFVESTEMEVGTIEQIQEGHQKIKAQLWKIVKVDGEEVSKEIFNKSSYNPSNTIYEVGVTSDNPAAVAEIKAAIATQNEETILEVVAKWAPEEKEPTDSETTGEDNSDSGESGTGNSNSDEQIPDTGTSDSEEQTMNLNMEDPDAASEDVSGLN